MTLTESTACLGPINPISTDEIWTETIAAAITPCLSHRIFSFVVEAKVEPIEENETDACDGDGNLRAILNVVSGPPANNRPEVRLIEAYDSIGDNSII